MLTRRKTQHIASRQSIGKNETGCMFGYVLWKSTNKTQVQGTYKEPGIVQYIFSHIQQGFIQVSVHIMIIGVCCTS